VKRNWRKLTSRTGRHFGRALLGISAACTVVAVTVVIVPSAYGQGSSGISAGTGSIQHTYTFTCGNETPNASQSGPYRRVLLDALVDCRSISGNCA